MFYNLFTYIYIVIAVLMVVFDLGKTKQKGYDRVYNAVYIFLALLVAFRYYVGSDTPVYMYMYDSLPTIDRLRPSDFLIYRAQPLFILLYVLCKTVWDNFVLLQIIQAFLFFHSFYLLLDKLDLKKFYLLYIFFGYMYLAEMSALRESLGLAFCFYAMQFYLKNKWLPYYVLVLCGFLFHSSMILFALFPFVRLIKKLSVRNVLILIGITLLIPSVYFYFLGFDINVADNSIMRGANEDQEATFKLSSLLYTVAILSIVVFYVVIKKKKFDEMELREDFIYLGGVVYVMLGFIGSAYFPIMYRLTSHFAVFFFYAIYIVLRRTKRNIITAAAFIVLVFYSPTVRFISTRGEGSEAYRTAYCSVFSSDADKNTMKTRMSSGTYMDIYQK